MGDYFALLVLVMVIAWAANAIYSGYRDSTAPPLTLIDNGNGMKEPVCPDCKTRLVTMTRRTESVLVGLVAWVFMLGGGAMLLFVHWLAGLVAILLGVVINSAGKGDETVLTCPSCQKDIRRLG